MSLCRANLRAQVRLLCQFQGPTCLLFRVLLTLFRAMLCTPVQHLSPVPGVRFAYCFVCCWPCRGPILCTNTTFFARFIGQFAYCLMRCWPCLGLMLVHKCSSFACIWAHVAIPSVIVRLNIDDSVWIVIATAFVIVFVMRPFDQINSIIGSIYKWFHKLCANPLVFRTNTARRRASI